MTFSIGFMLGIWAVAFVLTLWSTYLTLKHFKLNAPYKDTPFRLFPVSVLKPLKGKDQGLEKNLESFFILDYPEYELIFSVADALDPACGVVRKLMQQHPNIPSRLIIGAVDIGTNPKINNLIRSYDQVKNDWILISDSNVRVERDYLRKLMASIDASTGIVTSVVCGRDPVSLGGHLEALYLNTFYARGMLLASAVGHPCVVGKSMLFRKSTLERFGGLKNLSRYLAEDYMAGEAMRKLGLKAVTAHDSVGQHIGEYSVKDFWSRHIRWGRIRKAQAPIAFAIEPFLGSIITGIFGAFAFLNWLEFSPALFLFFHLLVWSLCDAITIRTLGAKTSVLTPIAWFIRELSALPLWFHIASGNTVNWRGRLLVVKPGGLLEDSQHRDESVPSHAKNKI